MKAPPIAQRRLQPVVDKFFYGLCELDRDTAPRRLVGVADADDEAAARGEAHALLARPLRHRRREVRDYRMMLRQNEMRRNAEPAARAAHRHPQDRRCSSISTTAGTSKRIRTKTGRELLELFTMGVGHYGERDVRERRAFTGWTNDVLSSASTKTSTTSAPRRSSTTRARSTAETSSTRSSAQAPAARVGKICRCFRDDLAAGQGRARAQPQWAATK